MKKKLNQDDLYFIEWLNKQLQTINFPVALSSDEKTFSWVEKTSKQYKKINYKDNMIQALTNDLKNGTKTYTYQIYSLEEPILKVVGGISELLLRQVKNSPSTEFKLRMLNLFDGEGASQFFQDMLSFAKTRNDTDFILEILKKGQCYGEINHQFDNGLINRLYRYYKWLNDYSTVNPEIVAQSFVSHFKNSDITISETNLINLFQGLFKEQYLPILFNAFNIQNEPLFSEAKEKKYLDMSINLKTLALSKMYKNDIKQIFEVLSSLNQDIHFPSCLIFKENENHLQLLIEALDKDSEKKIKMLFEQLVATKYEYHQDEQHDFQTLHSIVNQINEIIYIDSVIQEGDVNKQIYHKKILKV
jgi:hypothetical protein